MKIVIELDTAEDSEVKIMRVLDVLRGVEVEKTPKTPEIITLSVPSKEYDNSDLKRFLREIKDDLKEFDRTRDKKRARLYTTEFKKKFVKFYKIFSQANPKITQKEKGKIVGIPQSTFVDWLKGEKLGSVGKKPSGRKVKEKVKKVYNKPKMTRWGTTYESIKERNEKMIDHLNKNPYDSWEEVGEKFKLSSTGVYAVAKNSGKVRIMKRLWEKMIEKKDLEYKPYKSESQKEEENKPKEKKELASIILKFEHSKKSPEETIIAINECISKGILSFKDDADKFGFDRRQLPTSDWFNFITEVAKKVNTMLEVDVTLSPAMTGITFKR